MDDEVIVKALIKMSNSPVKADNKAIERLENETGLSIHEIISYLEIQAISYVAWQDLNKSLSGKKVNAFVCCIEGIFFSCLVGLGTLFFKPEVIPQSMALSFGAATARSLVSKYENSREGL